MIQPKRTLKVDNGATVSRKSSMGELVATFLHAATKTHMTHLRTTSFAAHCALGEFYETLPGLVDSVAEQYQGATEQLLEYPQVTVAPINTPEEAVSHLRSLHALVDRAQSECMYSEINSELDLVKSLIDKTKYKLIFLQ